jgi:hypothetical protein
VSSVIQAIWPPRVAVFYTYFSLRPCASEGSGSTLVCTLPTLQDADVLATLPMYDPGMLASWYRRRYGSLFGCRWDDRNGIQI